jgi:tyrosine-protein kinase Etk/Wzc
MTMANGSNNSFVQGTESILSEIDFTTIFMKVLHYKWFILGTTLLAFLCGLFYTFTITPRYVTTALIQVDSQLGSANNIQQMLGSVGSSFTTLEKASPAEIEIALIQSRFILQSVIDKFRLNVRVTPSYVPLFGAMWAKYYQKNKVAKPFLGLSQFAWGGEQMQIGAFNTASPLTGMSFLLRAQEGEQYGLYLSDGTLLLQGKVGKMAHTSPDTTPRIHLLLTKLKANPGTNFTISLRHGDDVLADLTKNLSVTDLGYKNKTKTGILQLSYYGSNPKLIAKILNTIVDVAIQRNIEKKSAEASKTLDFLNRQLPHVRKSLEEAETILNEYRSKSGTIDITQKAKLLLTQLSTIEQSIAEVKLKKVEMLQELTPQHPFVIALERKQVQLQKQIIDLENKIRTLPGTDQKALSLERDVKVKNQLYLLLLNNIQQLQVLKAGTLSDTRILSQALTPIVPLPTHNSFTLMCATLVGFFISLVIIFLRELLQNKATDHELIEETLGISTYAIIPFSPTQKKIASKIKHSSERNRISILAQTSPKDVAMEAIRSLRTMLQFNLEHARNNIISILGASPSIGKSFISINLAQVLSECGKRVILIDGDMRKGKIYQYLAQHKSPGLAEILAQKETWQNSVCNQINSFDFISCGNYPLHPSELLLTKHLDDLLQQLSQNYDIVLLDTSPVLAVTDPIIVAKHSSINLMVIGAGADKISELELMVKRVKKNGIVIQGFILNNISQVNHTYGQTNYYYAYESVG